MDPIPIFKNPENQKNWTGQFKYKRSLPGFIIHLELEEQANALIIKRLSNLGIGNHSRRPLYRDARRINFYALQK